MSEPQSPQDSGRRPTGAARGMLLGVGVGIALGVVLGNMVWLPLGIFGGMLRDAAADRRRIK